MPCLRRDSNPWPFGWESDVLNIRPRCSTWQKHAFRPILAGFAAIQLGIQGLNQFIMYSICHLSIVNRSGDRCRCAIVLCMHRVRSLQHRCISPDLELGISPGILHLWVGWVFVKTFRGGSTIRSQLGRPEVNNPRLVSSAIQWCKMVQNPQVFVKFLEVEVQLIWQNGEVTSKYVIQHIPNEDVAKQKNITHSGWRISFNDLCNDILSLANALKPLTR
jgi:hypothetical protein